MDWPIGKPRPFIRILHSIPGFLYVRVWRVAFIHSPQRTFLKLSW